MRARALAIVAAVALGLSVSFAVVVHAADQRLTQADAALQTATGLVLASEPGSDSLLVRALFKFHVNQAARLTERARDHIEAAKQISDGSG